MKNEEDIMAVCVRYNLILYRLFRVSSNLPARIRFSFVSGNIPKIRSLIVIE